MRKEEQFKSKCLESDSYYNEWIYCKIAKVNMKGL
jgi:hypothetical protein